MEKNWSIAEEKNTTKAEILARELNINECLAKILVQRGIYDFENARNFFRPQLSKLHDPFLMKDMDRAIERISKALKNEEGIMVYGDYDVDGTTAVALTYHFFSQFTSNITYYIPDRHKEGYGISKEGIDFAASNNYSLIIALDCGIRSVDKVDYAKQFGIDFIICDHHLPAEKIPSAVAVLDPKREDCNYPFKELSGCGIGFKLVQAYCKANNLPSKKYECYLDLCMVSIAADIVAIVDENRILAHFGLLKINENPCHGLQALMQISGKTNTYDITDVVFKIAPRINAAGRMGDAKNAVKILLSNEVRLADEQSLFINAQNTERKSFDQNITAEALALIESDENLINKKSTVVFKNDWNKGVIGIVASRLIETYYRPTIVLTESNGNYTGSARSVEGYDLYEALLACSHLLEQFGGHKYAAGLTLKPENLNLFIQKFEEVVAATITPDLLQPEIKINCELDLTQVDAKFHRVLMQMGPFGPENMAPVFVSKNVKMIRNPQIVGTNNLKLFINQQNSSIFECIGFGLGEFERKLQINQPFDVCYSIEENVWNDKKRLQLNLKGIKIH